MLVVNYKNYQISMEQMLDIAKGACVMAERYKIHIALAPPTHLLTALQAVINMAQPDGEPLQNVAVISQHVDIHKPGSSTGFVVPEVLADSGIRGSLINHSEHRLDPLHIEEAVSRLRDLGMISIVCTQDVRESGAYAALDPDYIAIEPPELIGTGRSVSTHEPRLIQDAAAAVLDAGTDSRLCAGPASALAMTCPRHCVWVLKGYWWPVV